MVRVGTRVSCGMDGGRRHIGLERERIHARMGEGEKEKERASDAWCATLRGRENETVHSCFIGPLRPVLVTEVGWVVCGGREGEDEKRG